MATPPPPDAAPIVIATPSSSFDLDSYISNYSRRAKILRLKFIASRAPTLELEALKLAIQLVKDTSDVELYKTLVESAAGRLGPAGDLDAEWVERTTKANQKALESMDFEFQQAKTKQVREYTRMGYNNFGQHHYECGNLQEALRCYTRTRDYSSSGKHVVEMCLNVIRVAIECNMFTHVTTYVTKAEQTPEPLEPLVAAKLGASSGLALLDQNKYSAAATVFLGLGVDLGSEYNEVISLQDIATYGTLCALATLDRAELRAKVVESASFKQLIELVPMVREVAHSFHASNYAQALSLLDKMKGDLLMDMHLSAHVEDLYTKVRNRALVQYCSPFLSVRLSTMAEALNTNPTELSKELAQLIMAGDIKARIDGHNKILYAREEDVRGTTFTEALEAGEAYVRATKALLLRVELTRNDFSVRAPGVRRGGETAPLD
eukprot:CAMPEP_0175963292 /NCGR_PEP_ID=MMETSP0108-20121206/36940_1 /TAXON_ID=195067 ORGANISM="Goniomonas pacifica, Strain CCMP1869" /NCGR_SAMPLE_ID=MMETSP0108 /ASSEMBLY_ACC=CAM_ASM_000204 /LENGTH=434 /DNA_ID=CAMNT_0017291177 /DNA_START=13 /DNA_END=1317 /DNA_ORIENTATION=+